MTDMTGTLGSGLATARPVFDLEARAIADFHDRILAGNTALTERGSPDIWRWIEENHRSNSALWREEDRARRTDVPDRECRLLTFTRDDHQSISCPCNPSSMFCHMQRLTFVLPGGAAGLTP